MSNPYAPPEDRSRPTDDEPGAHAADPTGPTTPLPDGSQHPGTPPPAQYPVPHSTQLPSGPTPRPIIPTEPVGAERARRSARLFGLLLLGAVALSALPEPARAVALPFVVAATVFGIRALVQASRAHVRGGLAPMLAGGVVISVVWALYLGTLILLWPIYADRQECMARALTVAATDECTRTFDDDIADLRDRARG